MSRQLWLVGQFRVEIPPEGVIWDFQGVFDTKDRAVAACRHSGYFYAPITLNEELPDATKPFPDAEYPIT